MENNVQRFCLQAKPMDDNSEYFEWETASIVIFILEKDKDLALRKARDELIKRKWELVKFESKSTLIEERVRIEGGKVLEAFEEVVLTGGSFFKVFPNNVFAGRKHTHLLKPARITEDFIDKVVSDAGGRRLTPEEIGTERQNADYLLGEYIFELKDLQEDGLEKGEHQEKLIELFAPYFSGEREAVIDPSILSTEDLKSYLDIFGSPIKTHVKKASKQIKSSRVLLNNEKLKGGIIVLNTGFSSYPHDLFGEQVDRYARKDSKQLEAVIAITMWVESNGFDSYAFYKFWPDEPSIPEIASLKNAFSVSFEKMMTDLMVGNLPDEIPKQTPRKPIVFSAEDIDFRWEPLRVPLPWQDKEGSG